MGACHQRPNGLSWPVPETPFSKMGNKAGSRLSVKHQAGMSSVQGCTFHAAACTCCAARLQLPGRAGTQAAAATATKGTNVAISGTMEQHAAWSKNLPSDL